MSIKKSKIWSLSLLLAILMLAFAGCSPSPEPEEDAGNVNVDEGENEVSGEEEVVSDEETESEPEEEAEPEANQEPVTMTFWDPSTDEGINGIFTQMFDSFQAKYPHITVENSHQGDYVQKLKTAFAAEATPDLIWAWANPSTFYEFVEAGLVMDLEDEYNEFGWREYFPDAMYEAMLGPDGKPYGVPDFINGTVITYNKEMFDELGLEEPQTWEEWMNVLNTLQENDITPIGLGLSDGNWQSKRLFEMILNSTAGREWTEALYAGEHAWTDEPVLEAFQKLEEMGDYIAEGSLGFNSRQGWALWYQGDAAMIVSDTWQFSLHDRDATFEWDFFTFPKINPDVDTTFVGAVSDVMYIPVHSEHPEEAVLFLDHFLTPELQGYWIDYGLPFAAGDHFGILTEESVGPKNVDLMNYITENGFTTWFDVGNPSEIVVDAAPLATAAVLNGEMTPEEAVQSIQDVADSLD